MARGHAPPSLQVQKAFSIPCPRRYGALSWVRLALRLRFGGMSASPSGASQCGKIAWGSQAPSANRVFASIPSIKEQAASQSSARPSVMATVTGRPCASAAICIFVSSPFYATHCRIAPRHLRMQMPLGVTGIHHSPFKVRPFNPLPRQGFPDALVSPATRPSVAVFPISLIRRYIQPRGSCARYPGDRARKRR